MPRVKAVTEIRHQGKYTNVVWSKEWLNKELTNEEVVIPAMIILKDTAEMMNVSPKSLALFLAGALAGNESMSASKSKETAEGE